MRTQGTDLNSKDFSMMKLKFNRLSKIVLTLVTFLLALCTSTFAEEDSKEKKEPERKKTQLKTLALPRNLEVVDKPWDAGDTLLLKFDLSKDDTPPKETDPKKELTEKEIATASNLKINYIIYRSEEENGKFDKAGQITAKKKDYKAGVLEFEVEKCKRGEPYFFRVQAIQGTPEITAKSEFVSTKAPIIATRQWFDWKNFRLVLVTFITCGAVIAFILLARSGRPYESPENCRTRSDRRSSWKGDRNGAILPFRSREF